MKRLAPLIVVLGVVIIAAAVFMSTTRKPTAIPSPVSPTMHPEGSMGGMAGGGGAGGAQSGGMGDLARLGVSGRPHQADPQGLQVTGFSGDSPLAAIGVEKDDIIVSCNGEQQRIGARCLDAIQGLQERGEPVTLVVVRDGKQVTLERAEKLPESIAGGK